MSSTNEVKILDIDVLEIPICKTNFRNFNDFTASKLRTTWPYLKTWPQRWVFIMSSTNEVKITKIDVLEILICRKI